MLLALLPLMISVAANPSITGIRRSISTRAYMFGAGALRSISIATSPSGPPSSSATIRAPMA